MKTLKVAIKGVFSVLLLVWVFASVSWDELVAELSDVHLGYLALFFLTGLLQILLSAWKWQILSRARGLHMSLPRSLVLYLKGIFFSQLLPTNVGGDAVRAYELGHAGKRLTASFASVFMERFTGLVVLVLYALIAIPLTPVLIEQPGVQSLLGVTVLGLLLGSWLVFDARARCWLEARFHGRLLGRLTRKAGKLQDAVTAYRHQRAELVASAWISVAYYALAVLSIWLAGLALGVAVSVSLLTGAVALLLLIFLIPLSIGGLGLHEWGFTQVLALIGVAPAIGLAMGLLHRARTVTFALMGGGAYPLEAMRSAAPIRSSIPHYPDPAPAGSEGAPPPGDEATRPEHAAGE